MAIKYQLESARHRLEIAAVEYVLSRSGISIERQFHATVELDRACHAVCVALDDTGTVCMPSGYGPIPASPNPVMAGLRELRDSAPELPPVPEFDSGGVVQIGYGDPSGGEA